MTMMTMLFLPVIPYWFIYMCIVLIITEGVFILAKTRKVKGTHLAVLGMSGAGKTRFYRFLQGKEYNEELDNQTDQQVIESFDYKLSNGKSIHISKGIDLGGNKDVMINHYEELIKNNEIVVFVFDLFKYLQDVEYQKETNAIAYFINKHKLKDRNIVKLATHKDMFECGKKLSKNEVKYIFRKFKKKIHEKEYWNAILDYNFFFVDMRSKEELEVIANKIFGK